MYHWLAPFCPFVCFCHNGHVEPLLTNSIIVAFQWFRRSKAHTRDLVETSNAKIGDVANRRTDRKCFNTNNALSGHMASHSLSDLVHPSKGCWKRMSKVGLAKRVPQVKPSHGLTAKRGDWRTTATSNAGKTLSFEIRRIGKLRAWKSSQVSHHLHNPSNTQLAESQIRDTQGTLPTCWELLFADMLWSHYADWWSLLLNQFNESKLGKRQMNADSLQTRWNVFPTMCFQNCLHWLMNRWTVHTGSVYEKDHDWYS